MPVYYFVNPDQVSTSTITYSVYQRGEWWFKRTVQITHPQRGDEVYYQSFGPYQSIEEAEKQVELAKLRDSG